MENFDIDANNLDHNTKTTNLSLKRKIKSNHLEKWINKNQHGYLKRSKTRPAKSEIEWLRIADEFKNTWDLEHCIGAIDGKYICIENPPNSGYLYYNYKGFYSIVLLAICNAKYNSTLLDVGQYGINNDAGVRANSLLGQMLENNSLKLSSPAQLEGCNYNPLPY